MVAVIPGCSVHTYWIVPALSGVNEKVPSFPKSLDLKSAPESAVTLWSAESSLVHVTCCPALTVTSLGSKAMFCILIATPPPLADDDEDDVDAEDAEDDDAKDDEVKDEEVKAAAPPRVAEDEPKAAGGEEE